MSAHFRRPIQISLTDYNCVVTETGILSDIIVINELEYVIREHYALII